MMPLVEGLKAEKGSQGLGGSGGSFVLPVDSGGVVRAGVDGMFTEVKGVDQHILLHEGCSQFEVRVGHHADGIVPGDKGGLDMGREMGMPKDGGMSILCHT